MEIEIEIEIARKSWAELKCCVPIVSVICMVKPASLSKPTGRDVAVVDRG